MDLPVFDGSGRIRDYASYSFFSRFDTCPLQWAYKYLLGLPETRTGPQLLGLSVHEVFSRLHHGIIPNTPQAVAQDFEESFTTLRPFKKEMNDNLDPADIDWGVKDLQKAEDQANWMFGVGHEITQGYAAGPIRDHTPLTLNGKLASEYELWIPVEQYGGKRVKRLLAYVDLVYDGKKWPRITDYKTKSYQRISPEKYITDLQPLLYAFGFEELGLIPTPVEFQYLQFVYKKDKAHGRTITYDTEVGGVIEPWKVDVFRQATLPFLIENVERHLEMAEDFDYFKRKIRSGSHCNQCDWRNQFCPLYVPPLITL